MKITILDLLQILSLFMAFKKLLGFWGHHFSHLKQSFPSFRHTYWASTIYTADLSKINSAVNNMDKVSHLRDHPYQYENDSIKILPALKLHDPLELQTINSFHDVQKTGKKGPVYFSTVCQLHFKYGGHIKWYSWFAEVWIFFRKLNTKLLHGHNNPIPKYIEL